MAQPAEGRWALIVHGGAREMEPGEGEDGLTGAKDGRIGWAHNSPAFAIAYASRDSPEPEAYLSKEDERRG